MTEGLPDGGVPAAGLPGPKPRKIRWVVLIGALAIGLLGSSGVIAYSVYSKLDLSLQGLQTAYLAEQTAAKRLARKAEDLSRAVEQAQTRVKTLEESQKASEDDRGKLEARNTKLETAVQGLQTAYTTEQAAARKTAQRAEELSKTLEEAQAQVRILEATQKASAQEKNALEARSSKLETTVQELQTAYAAERAAASKLTQKTEELSKALEEVHARTRPRERTAPGEKSSDLAASNHALGLSYSERGMHDEALKAFQTALRLDPNYAEAHFELARLYLGHFDDKRSAVPHLRRYLQLNPTGKDAERVKGWLLRVEKELDAEKERQGWGKMSPGQGLKRIFE